MKRLVQFVLCAAFGIGCGWLGGMRGASLLAQVAIGFAASLVATAIALYIEEILT